MAFVTISILPIPYVRDRTNAQERVGDGNCDTLFMNSDCDYDGGDIIVLSLMSLHLGMASVMRK